MEYTYSLEPKPKGDTSKFDREEADASKDGHRHDNPHHPSWQDHQRGLADAADRASETDSDSDSDSSED